MTSKIDERLLEETLTRAVDRIYPSKEALKEALLSGKKIKIYLGIDPTSPHLHLGHAASLLTLSRFQELGQEVILLIGDFTGRIGDPTDKLSSRQPLTEGDVKTNFKTFKEQAAKILDFSGTHAAHVDYNSRWHDKMTFKDLIGLAQEFTVQQMIERDMFQKRLHEGKPIGLHEFLYPLMQGYDSVAMDVDAEIGGTDQTFNMLAGRTLMRSLKNKEKFVITNRLLVDPISGKKLSKTEGSLVNLDDAPEDMFGKIMALPDGMIIPVAELSTRMPMEKIEELKKTENPRDAKLMLAEAVVALYHDSAAAVKAKENFEKLFSKKEIPDELPELRLAASMTPVDAILASGVAKSKSEAARLVEQGSFELEGEKITQPREPVAFNSGMVLKIGKKNFFRITI